MHGKISKWQFVFLIVFNQIGLAILIEPAIIAERAGKGSVIALLLALAASFVLLLIHIGLLRAYPGRDLAGIMEGILGKWTGKTIMLVFLLGYPLFIASFVVRSMSDFVRWAFLPNTPEVLIAGLFLVNILFLARSEVTVMAHLSQLLFWPIIMLFVLLLLFVLPVAEPENLLPMMNVGMKPIVKSALLILVFPFMETILFLMFVPYADDPRVVAGVLWRGLLISGVILLAIMLLTIMVLGAELVSISLFPAYLLSQKISMGNFLERLEVFMAIIWFVTLFFRAATMFIIVCLGLTKVFNLPTHKSIATPVAFCVIGLSSIIIRNTQDYSGIAGMWLYYALMFSVLLPLLLLVIHWCKQLVVRRGSV